MTKRPLSTMFEDGSAVKLPSIDCDRDRIEVQPDDNEARDHVNKAEVSLAPDAIDRPDLIAQSKNEIQKKKVYSMKGQLDMLESAIINTRPPHCAGTVSLGAGDLVLYYGKKASARRIDFSNVNNKSLKHLFNSCDKMTSGRDNDDINIRMAKSGKLDVAYFSTNISVEYTGLMDAVRYDLLMGEECRRPIKAELDSLNVFGQGSFSRAHKDVPSSTTLFGYLVIVLPTSHKDGAFFLRHGEKAWVFDPAKALSETPDPHLHIAYVAFLSGVEHAITPVKSGYRVTLTYNLYFDESARSTSMTLPRTLPANESIVKSAFQVLLEDGTFLPEGGYLGFGLSHRYPVEVKPIEMNALDFIARNLKGSDALLMNACMHFKLDASLNIVYLDDLFGTIYEVLIDKVVDLEGRQLDEEESLWEHLRKHGAKLVNIIRKKDWDDAELDFRVYWVTKKTAYHAQSATYISYRFWNKADVRHAYGRICLVVKVGPAGNRETVGD